MARVGEVESTKSVSEIYAPRVGTVATVNDALRDAPEVLNADPYGEGWICDARDRRRRRSSTGLLDAAAYAQLTDA